jgi:hypothetical protein
MSNRKTGQLGKPEIKKNIDKAAKAADKRSAKANRYNPTKEELIGSKNKRQSKFGEIAERQQKEKDLDMGYTTLELKTGGKIGRGCGAAMRGAGKVMKA